MINQEYIQQLINRRSIKNFSSKQISTEELNAVLKVGTYAPTGRGKQSPTMVVVQDPETVALLSRLNAQVLGTSSDPFYGAPTIIVVLGDPESHTWMEDACLVMGNLMHAAPAAGLGSCWIHRAKEVFSMPEGKKLLKKWGLSENLVGVAHLALGYAAGEPKPQSPRKDNYFIFD